MAHFLNNRFQCFEVEFFLVMGLCIRDHDLNNPWKTPSLRKQYLNLFLQILIINRESQVQILVQLVCLYLIKSFQ